MKKLSIYGAGGAGRELASFLNSTGEWSIEGFVDDVTDQKMIDGIPVLGKRDFLDDYKGNVVVQILNDAHVREKIISGLKNNPGIIFPRIIAPGCWLANTITWGEGVVINLPMTLVSAGVRLGDFVFLNCSTAIGHDTDIGDYSIVYSHIEFGGGVKVGHHTIIGSGSTIRPHTNIGNNVIVGGGSMVVQDVPDNVVVAGVPAKILREIG
jgi:sugar O-acyltransferase (sialic acid O-acetyltransferase NeuD family)